MPVSLKKIQRLAGFELNALHMANVFGREFEKVKVPSSGTPVYDVNGTILFYRMPLSQLRNHIGYTDIAAVEDFGEPLLAVTRGEAWDEKAILAEAEEKGKKVKRDLRFDSIRFVAYSFPKIALQFLLNRKEVLMLEWKSWKEVPQVLPEDRKKEKYGFERWSLLDALPADIRKERREGFKKRTAIWDSAELARIEPSVVTKPVLDISIAKLKLVDTREIHYSPRADDHVPCYELRGQQTNVWCVAASVEMLLNYYRYQYTQQRLAQELGLGTCDVPNGLPYGDENKVVTTIEKLSSNTLNATAIPNPVWAVYHDEIAANRPLISFIPRHSRTVAGYTHTLIHLFGELPFRGLLVYDPWPNTDCAHPELGGVITRWENFNTSTYRYAFTAELKHV